MGKVCKDKRCTNFGRPVLRQVRLMGHSLKYNEASNQSDYKWGQPVFTGNQFVVSGFRWVENFLRQYFGF